MTGTIQTISILNLSLSFIPVLVVLVIMSSWALNSRTAIYAVMRMLIQLILIGYVLTYIFATDQAWIVILVLAIMLAVSSWIALRPLKDRQGVSYLSVFGSISLGGVTTLFLVTGLVLELHPWFLPQFMIPLAGMIFSNAMNTVSLAAERFAAEKKNNVPDDEARRIALNAALIPVINSLFAVGIVSLPGMMTGQILSGISPLIAVRYQIMVMCMIFGSAGISAACYLALLKPSARAEVA